MTNLFKNKRGDEGLTAKEVVEIVLAVIGLFILLGLAVMLWGSHKKTEIQQAEATLTKAVNQMNILNEDESKEIFFESPKGWYFVSIETNSLKGCEDDFCLCLCNGKKCKNYVCKKTDGKFVLLRSLNEKEVRLLEEEMPFLAEISFIENKVYPFNFKEYPLSVSSLFFKFNSGEFDFGAWQWSRNLGDWNDLNRQVSWNILELPDYNLKKNVEDLMYAFEIYLSEINYDGISEKKDKGDLLLKKGEEFLNKANIKKSEGILILRVK